MYMSLIVWWAKQGKLAKILENVGGIANNNETRRSAWTILRSLNVASFEPASTEDADIYECRMCEPYRFTASAPRAAVTG
jgi:hypothetical protein